MKRYEDFYGCTATIKPSGGGVTLVMKTGSGRLIAKKEYPTERGAKIAMGKSGDGWREVV